MSDTEGIILGTSLSIGITSATFLLAFLAYKFSKRYRERHGPPPDPTPSDPQPLPVEEVVRPQRSQYSEVTLRFFEEFGINGYQPDPEAGRQIETARENRVRPNDVLPQYHEVVDPSLPSYYEAVNVQSGYRIENERY
ncbi:uncharacterized protein [Chironomus tepperi]|uniref:uncharacterized protein n=1 Tax=Chironomus tepperi TaxID=113505 RepID=UPI00391EF7BD